MKNNFFLFFIDKKKQKSKQKASKSSGQLAKSIDDFYTLYDMVASGKEIEFDNPPSPGFAQNDISNTIEPLRKVTNHNSTSFLFNSV